MSRVPFVATLITAAFTPLPLTAIETGLDEGQLFPDLVLPEIRDGRCASISSFRGKKTLLISFASW